MTKRSERYVRESTTSTLRAMKRWLDKLPLFVMSDLRNAIEAELLGRELPDLAEESGGFPVASVRGVQ